MNEEVRKPIDAGTLAAGLGLVALGLLFLFDRFRIADAHYLLRHYWPLIIVFFGVVRLLRRQVWGGLWLITIGVWMQIATLHLFGMTFSSSWPLLLIALGAGIIARTLTENVRRHGA
ncbi:MAG TPA: DUF5668 domain-containing protein [Thermoanaerobaculia bacterium]|jgi:hypothetical protein|nr:DUF5668 domain-containing protein [Thermoanaerobaculia bacterium]